VTPCLTGARRRSTHSFERAHRAPRYGYAGSMRSTHGCEGYHSQLVERIRGVSKADQPGSRPPHRRGRFPRHDKARTRIEPTRFPSSSAMSCART